MKQNYRAQKGFTLIELMIVVAIIGILAAIALPAYQNYTARAQASEGMTVTGGLRVDMAEFWALNGAWPTGVSTAATLPAGNIRFDVADITAAEYISGATVAADGLITLTWDQTTSGLEGTMTIAPRTPASGPQSGWVCAVGPAADGTMDAQHLPTGCR